MTDLSSLIADQWQPIETAPKDSTNMDTFRYGDAAPTATGDVTSVPRQHNAHVSSVDTE